jgi:hypothetical protein
MFMSSNHRRHHPKVILPTRPRRMLSIQVLPANCRGASNNSTMKLNNSKVNSIILNCSFRQIRSLRFQVCSVLCFGPRQTRSRLFRARPYMLWILLLTHRFLEQHLFFTDRHTLLHPVRLRLIHEYPARLPFPCPLVVHMQLLEKCSLVSKCL